ncbi:class I adenylate-forming enzyme family protein [Flavisphingomonas formosensis]|uniref:class I adenylate-forming enzyme family protein n=1 Tax=Flavisphingomonas formosensis TaxID=861534 RepID=UPI001E63D959|nr:fatty acid--CoA ligase family protein [Sphingomonas formosensis]
MAAEFIDRIMTTLSERADGRAIEYGGVWSTWRDVRSYGDGIEAALEKAGCVQGGRVAFVIRNRVAHAATLIGLLVHRRAVSFIYPFAPPAAIADQLRDLKPVAVIADVQDWPHIRDAAAEIGSAGIALAGIDTAPDLLDGLDRSSVVPSSSSPRFEDAAIEVLSSGTTGAPKRIPMPVQVLDRAVSSAPQAEDGGELPVQINIWPLSGVGGICLLAASAATGTPLVQMERFTVEEFVSAMKRHRPPMLGMSPTALNMIMNADVPPEILSSVAAISGGSAHLEPDLQDRFEEKYGIPIYWALGATEFCGTIIRWTPAMRREVGDSKRGSVGLPMPGVSLRAVDPDSGRVLPPGEAGLMEVLCPQVRDDWVRTTDLVTIDADGYVFHRGRHDGAIVRGGFKILPERVVEVLRTHPSVADASVVGIPDARLGAVPVAAVELKSAASSVEPSELAAHVRATLPPTYVPTIIRIVDALPRTPSLKVSLREVRSMFDETAVG